VFVEPGQVLLAGIGLGDAHRLSEPLFLDRITKLPKAFRVWRFGDGFYGFFE
jgi:hypothetical protein